MKEGLAVVDSKPKMETTEAALVVHGRPAQGEEAMTRNQFREPGPPNPMMSQPIDLSLSLTKPDKGKAVLDLNALPVEEDASPTPFPCI